MKSEILSVLSSGSKSVSELIRLLSGSDKTKLLETIQILENCGLIEGQSRQIHEGNNVFRWDRELSLS